MTVRRLRERWVLEHAVNRRDSALHARLDDPPDEQISDVPVACHAASHALPWLEAECRTRYRFWSD